MIVFFEAGIRDSGFGMCRCIARVPALVRHFAMPSRIPNDVQLRLFTP